MRRQLCLIVLLFCFGTALAAPPPGWPETDAAVQSAEQIAERLDAGDYRLAWQDAALLFQALNPERAWIGRQQAIRGAYGPTQSRQFQRLDQRNHYALSPDGHYCIVQFSSSFQNKRTTIETMVMVETPSGDWQLREYVIR